METYKEAYNYYKKICYNLDLDIIPFYQFIRNLTEDQMQMYMKKAN